MVTYYKPRPENGTNELIAREHNLKIPVTCYLERTQVLEESFLPEANLYVFEEVRIQLLCSLTLSSSGGGGGFRDDFVNEKECCAEMLWLFFFRMFCNTFFENRTYRYKDT